ncbi:MAG: MarR family transcriptional regulator [Clostridia bacterium]|nr:MarR family transcriptional regulator [Clostridia bacterium]
MSKIMKDMNIISRCQLSYRSEMTSNELLGCHHPFVLAICRKPGMTQDEISRELCLNKSTVARALIQLEEKGYVKRESKPDDKRSVIVFPTDKMTQILPTVKKIADNFNEMISCDISENELEIFVSVLEKMSEKARKITQKTEGVVEK